MAEIQIKPPVTFVDNEKDMLKFVEHVRRTKECALDTETTGLNRWKDSVVFWSACPDVKSRYCFSRDMLDIYNKHLAKDESICWYFTNMTFDFCMLRNSGVLPPRGDSYCTLAMDWLYDENRRGGHGLKETAKEYAGLNMQEFKEAFRGKGRDESLHERLLRAMDEDFVTAVDYAATDAWATFKVFHGLRKKLATQSTPSGTNLWKHFQEIEMPFTRVLYNLIRRGIMVDAGYLSDLAPIMEQDILRIERSLNKLAGKEVNLNSPLQVRWLLFDKVGLKPIKMTKGGASGKKSPAVDHEVLTKYAEEGIESCVALLEHRKLSKTLNTYVRGLAKWLDPHMRIHPTLTQHVTVTGRLSSTDPNL